MPAADDDAPALHPVRAYFEQMVAERRPTGFLARADAAAVAAHAALLGHAFGPEELGEHVAEVGRALAEGRLDPAELLPERDALTTCQSPTDTLLGIYRAVGRSLDLWPPNL